MVFNRNSQSDRVKLFAGLQFPTSQLTEKFESAGTEVESGLSGGERKASHRHWLAEKDG